MSFTFFRSIGRNSTARKLGLVLIPAFVSEATTEKDRLVGHEEKMGQNDTGSNTKEDDNCNGDTSDEGSDTDEDEVCDSDTSDEGEKSKGRRALSSASASSPQRQPPVLTTQRRYSSYTHTVSSKSHPHELGVHEEHRCCCQKPTVPTQPPVHIVLDGDAGLKFLICITFTITLLYTLDRYM